MTEVPEHLLQRSRDRRRALGLPVPGEEAGAIPDVAATASANAPAVVGGAAPAQGKAPVPLPATPPPPPEEPTPPWVEAANARQKIPAWVMPVLLFLPIWAFMYVGTLEDPPRNEGLLYEGGQVYAEKCASCHGATGGGGSGPGFTGGAIIETFTDFESQIEWVVKGTDGFEAEGRAVYGDSNKVVGGSGAKMPAFGDQLTAEELTLAVLYERIELGGASEELELGEAVFDAMEHDEVMLGGAVLEEFAEDVDLADIMAAFAEIRAATAGDGETAAG